MTGDWKDKAREKKAREEAIDHCIADADKLPIPDAEKEKETLKCAAKVLTMPLKELDAFLATHTKEAPPSPPPASPPPSPEATLYTGLEGCDRESKKAKNPEEKREFLNYCHTKVVQEYERALAEQKAQAQAQREAPHIQQAEHLERLQEFCTEEEPCTQETVPDPKAVSYPLNLSAITEVSPLYEKSDEDALRFEAAHPISPSDAVITRKFSLLPPLELPERTRAHLQHVVDTFYNQGDPSKRHLTNAYFDVCFAHFQHVVNAMIREGLQLPPVVKINRQQKDAEGEFLRDEAGELIKKEIDYEVFAKDTQYAEKRFGALVIGQVKAAFKESPWLFARVPKAARRADETPIFQFHNRVYRCAGAVAYHIVRNYRMQWMVVSRLVETLLQKIKVPLKGTKAGKAPSLGRLGRRLYEEQIYEDEAEEATPKALVTIEPLATLFDREFPLHALVSAGREALKGLDLPHGYLNFVYLRNTYRYIRNLLRQACQAMNWKPETIKEFKAAKANADIERVLEEWLAQPHVSDALEKAKEKEKALPSQTELEYQFDSFLRRLSARLTKRVQFLLRKRKAEAKGKGSKASKAKGKGSLPMKKKKGRTFGEGSLDALIGQILAQDSQTFAELKSAKAWQKSRQKWRDQLYDQLSAQLAATDLRSLVHEVTGQVQAAPEMDFLRRIFDLRPARTVFVDGDFAEFLAFLKARIQGEAEMVLVKEFYGTLQPYLVQFLELLRNIGPMQVAQLQTLPFFRRPCYSGRSIPTAHAFDQKVCVVDHSGSTVTVTLQLEADVPLQFTLATQRRRKNPAGGDRFRPFIEEGWTERPGTLLKAPGRGLLLALPFSKALKAQAPVATQALMPARKAGLDLGLKDFGAISVCEGDREIARHFLDQWELVGRRTDWVLPPDPAEAATRRERFFNWKNRLRDLRQEAANYQAKLADYKNEMRQHGMSSKRLHHQRKFQELRRAWKRCWQKLTRLHEELARQLATRVVACCLHYRVATLRVEDLRWARHKPKPQAGYFLTALQVHWFHGQIQQRIKDLAKRAGLRVELVNARDTSKTCSKCGERGTRDDKRFTHQECPQHGGKLVQLDADLNAARNIVRALPHGLASD